MAFRNDAYKILVFTKLNIGDIYTFTYQLTILKVFSVFFGRIDHFSS